MAIVFATKTGNWSDPTLWNTGALPTQADDVYSNNFFVTINVSPTVLSIDNASTTGVAAGGRFEPTNGITLTCTAANGVKGSPFFSALASGQSCNVVGNCVSRPDSISVTNSSTGTLNIIGSITGANSSFGAAWGLLNSSTGTVNVTGNVNGGAQNGNGIHNASGGTVNVTGSVTGGTTAHGINNLSIGALTVTGTVTGGGSSGVNNASIGPVTINGPIVASSGAHGFTGGNPNAIVSLSGPFLTSSNGLNPVYATRWFWPNTNPLATRYEIRTANLATIRPLYTADSVGGNPAIGNVRSGTIYGPNNELTGTLAVPPAGSVAVGVPVDNTVGTASLTAVSPAEIATAVWAASSRTITDKAGFSLTEAERTAISVAVQAGILNEGDSQLVLNAIAAKVRTELAAELARMRNAATTQEVGEIVEGALTATPY